jgi:hypothetical protein
MPFDLSQYGKGSPDAGGPEPTSPTDLDLDLDFDTEIPELDPVVEDAAVRAFPELADKPERIAALVELVQAITGGGV